MRSDGTPLYVLASAVDDLAMDVTHVVRGEDLLSVTPKQILLYQALGRHSWPRFAHLPLIVGANRQPLSKRHGETSVEWYRDHGYLAAALVNYLALLGWSAGDGVTERFTVDELIELFTLEAVQKNPAAFDVQKLTALNGEKIGAPSYRHTVAPLASAPTISHGPMIQPKSASQKSRSPGRTSNWNAASSAIWLRHSLPPRPKKLKAPSRPGHTPNRR